MLLLSYLDEFLVNSVAAAGLGADGSTHTRFCEAVGSLWWVGWFVFLVVLNLVQQIEFIRHVALILNKLQGQSLG